MKYQVILNNRSWKTRSAVVAKDTVVGVIETPVVSPEAGKDFTLSPQEIADGLRGGLFAVKPLTASEESTAGLDDE